MISIRRAKKDDVKQVYEIYLEFLEEIKKYEPEVTTKHKKKIRAYVLKELKSHKHIFLLAFNENKLIGCIKATINESKPYLIYKKIANFDWIFISKKYRRKGVGVKLTRNMEQLLKDRGVEYCYLNVNIKNKDSISLQSKIGFKKHWIEFRKVLI